MTYQKLLQHARINHAQMIREFQTGNPFGKRFKTYQANEQEYEKLAKDIYRKSAGQFWSDVMELDHAYVGDQFVRITSLEQWASLKVS